MLRGKRAEMNQGTFKNIPGGTRVDEIAKRISGATFVGVIIGQHIIKTELKNRFTNQSRKKIRPNANRVPILSQDQCQNTSKAIQQLVANIIRTTLKNILF